jgi:hypothetical protein
VAVCSEDEGLAWACRNASQGERPTTIAASLVVTELDKGILNGEAFFIKNAPSKSCKAGPVEVKALKSTTRNPEEAKSASGGCGVFDPEEMATQRETTDLGPCRVFENVAIDAATILGTSNKVKVEGAALCSDVA